MVFDGTVCKGRSGLKGIAADSWARGTKVTISRLIKPQVCTPVGSGVAGLTEGFESHTACQPKEVPR